MLDRTDYDSWAQRIRLYCRGKENGIYILQSIDHGLFELGTTRDTLGTTPEGGVLLGPERPRTYDDLNDNDKKRFDANVCATNIVLQGLPKDIYKLINHNIETKAIWDNVKKFVTAVKLNKGLKEINHEQLYAYLKQHEKHATQDRLIIERITPTTNDQLAFVLSVQPYVQSSQVQSHQYLPSSAPPQSPHVQSLQYLQYSETSQLDSGYTQTDEILDTLTKQVALLAQSFRATLPQTNNQLRTSFNTRNQATVRDAGNRGALNRAGNANAGQGKLIKCYNSQENGAVLDEEELLFLAGEQTNTFDADVDNQPVRDLALNEDNIFQADECDAFDSDVDDEPTAQSIFMANLSLAGPTNLQAGLSNASILSETRRIYQNLECLLMDVFAILTTDFFRERNDIFIPFIRKIGSFSDSLERKSFSKKKSIPKTNVSEGLSKPVTIQNLPQTSRQAVRNTNVIKLGMYQIDTRTTQTRAPQLPQTYRNSNPHMSTSTGVTHRTSVSRPTPRSTQMKDKTMPNTSQVKFKKSEVEDHHRISRISNKTQSVTTCNDSLKSRTSNVNAVYATCGKCVFNSNHDACVYKFLIDMNARTKKPNIVLISTRKPKNQANKFVAKPCKKTVASESTDQNSKSYYRMLYEKTSKALKWWIE
ncbi:hypothetical protein Tco_1092693 [Tanacetum coccineum]|uniref:Integrase, catalytic region, zinc finger, CCHC-type, peptidase aspartic, catalytic n=1 Tax=Tanacetum coccineum TaxID=301880 RepID=A0ABQ5IAM0_9ASTR